MSHDVFVSHSSLDKLAADAICHGLESKGIRCWIAPRDQVAGRPYGQQITAAIEEAQVMVLVFSDHVNQSQAVLNEINVAAGANVTIVPFRIASVEFGPELHFYLGRMHWLDAFPQPVDAYIDTLAETVRRNLKAPAAAQSGAASASGAPTGAAPAGGAQPAGAPSAGASVATPPPVSPPPPLPPPPFQPPPAQMFQPPPLQPAGPATGAPGAVSGFGALPGPGQAGYKPPGQGPQPPYGAQPGQPSAYAAPPSGQGPTPGYAGAPGPGPTSYVGQSRGQGPTTPVGTPPKANMRPLIIVGGVFAAVVLLVLLVALIPHGQPTPPAPQVATGGPTATTPGNPGANPGGPTTPTTPTTPTNPQTPGPQTPSGNNDQLTDDSPQAQQWDTATYNSCVQTASQRTSQSAAQTYCHCVVTQLDEQLTPAQRMALTAQSPELATATSYCNNQAAAQ